MSALTALNRPLTLRAPATKARKSPLVVGGVPRADLLPPSVMAERRLRRAARGVGIGLIASLVLVLGGVAASFVHATTAAVVLEAERARTNELLASQSEYAEVSAALGSIDRLSQAESAVGAMDVEWQPYLSEIESMLPAGTTVTSVNVTAATPTVALPESLGAAGDTRAATLMYTVAGPDLAAMRDWLLALTELEGYSSAMLLSVSDVQGLYSAQVEIGVNSDIYSNRFAVAEASEEGSN